MVVAHQRGKRLIRIAAFAGGDLTIGEDDAGPVDAAAAHEIPRQQVGLILSGGAPRRDRRAPLCDVYGLMRDYKAARLRSRPISLRMQQDRVAVLQTARVTGI